MGQEPERGAPRTAPAPGQRSVTGGTLIAVGRALRFLGFVLAVGGGSGLARAFFSDPGPDVERIHWALRVLIVLAVSGTGWAVFDAGRGLVVRGRQHRAPVITSFEQLRGERYLLYLRPFALDERMSEAPPDTPGASGRSPFEVPGLTTEEFLIGLFSRHGRVVAVGRPGEQLPLLGAERGYLPLQDWRHTVSGLIQGAHTVLMSVAPGPGTVWEFTEVLRTTEPERLVLMIACDPSDYDLFRADAASEYAARRSREGGTWAPLPALPDCPEAPQPAKRKWAVPLRALVTFDRDWKPALFRFVVTVPRWRHVWTVRRLVRRQLEPVLGPLSALPEKRAADTVPPRTSADPPASPPPPAPPPRQPLLGSVLVHRTVTSRGRRTPGRRRRRT
ncbi:hypothetical protein GCM10019016_118370 [Streptomyces prasinosporus]|uniref:Uncharacterized protein n=1 Tax=Streptomyces prasinosporus TaxID=68256 RepID=A0ABP6UDY2_9ACTN